MYMFTDLICSQRSWVLLTINWHLLEVYCAFLHYRRMLSEYEMSVHLAKKGFMLNYLLWHQHGEV
jgi:hypothetical protein